VSIRKDLRLRLTRHFLYTIGYGGRKPSELIEALNEYEIHWVITAKLNTEQGFFYGGCLVGCKMAKEVKSE